MSGLSNESATGESVSPCAGLVTTIDMGPPPFACDPLLDFLLDTPPLDCFLESAAAEVTLRVALEGADPLCDFGRNACIRFSSIGVTRRCGVGTRGNSWGGSSWMGVGGIGTVVLKRIRSHLNKLIRAV